LSDDVPRGTFGFKVQGSKFKIQAWRGDCFGGRDDLIVGRCSTWNIRGLKFKVQIQGQGSRWGEVMFRGKWMILVSGVMFHVEHWFGLLNGVNEILWFEGKIWVRGFGNICPCKVVYE